MPKVDLTPQAMAALWSSAQDGEENESDIIIRLTQENKPKATYLVGKKKLVLRRPSPAGFTDQRFNVKFPEGFKIYRTYEGKRHEAVATRGFLKLDGRIDDFSSLGSLNADLGAKTESAWTSWFYDDDDGVKHSIMDLRDEE